MSKMTGAQRKAQILEAGAKLAAKNGAANVTRRMVAKQCKCAEGLISVYMGDSATAQKAYARKAKSLGLVLPDKAKSDAIGVKMRSHSPRDKRDARKRSAKEVEAIKRKRMHQPGDGMPMREVKPKPVRESKPRTAPKRALPSPGKAPTPPERKSAARKPKAYPVNDGPPQPMPPNLVGSLP